MRICVLHSSLKGARSEFEGVYQPSDPSGYTDQHVFEHRFITKAGYREELNFAAAESFDLYFNFMSSQPEDKVAGVDATRYVEEALRLPVIGISSGIIERSKDALYDAARRAWKPSVPCSYFSCAVVEMGNTPVALPPMIWRYAEATEDQCLSGDVKWYPETREEVFQRSEKPDLFDRIRKTAEEAYYNSEMHGCSWCSIDLGVSDSGTITVTAVNPMPPIFQVGYKSADTVIEKFFPGGHTALINNAIANFFLRNAPRLETVQRVAATYDGLAGGYDGSISQQVSAMENIRDLASKYAYDGVVLDLGCGTGLIGRLHDEKNGAGKAKFIGVDISSKMRAVCLEHKAYEAVILGPVQKILMVYQKPVDHIVCMGTLHFLSTYELSMVLSRSFQLARSSVTFSVEEIPRVYNDSLKAIGEQHMESLDHLAGVEAFGTPVGWKLVDRWRRFGRKSRTTGAEVYTSVFRFEREDQESFHWFMPESARKLSIVRLNTETNVVVDLDGGKAHVNADIDEIPPPTTDDSPTQMISVA